MKREETGNLSREELFEKIKRKCISRSRIDFYSGLLILFIIIVLFIYRGTNPFDDNDIFKLHLCYSSCMYGGMASSVQLFVSKENSKN